MKLIHPNLTAEEKAQEARLQHRYGPVDPKHRRLQLAAEHAWMQRRKAKR